MVVRAIKTSNLFGSVQTRTVTATVSVVVQDYNDNKPEFTRVSNYDNVSYNNDGCFFE